MRGAICRAAMRLAIVSGSWFALQRSPERCWYTKIPYTTHANRVISHSAGRASIVRARAMAVRTTYTTKANTERARALFMSSSRSSRIRAPNSWASSSGRFAGGATTGALFSGGISAGVQHTDPKAPGENHSPTDGAPSVHLTRIHQAPLVENVPARRARQHARLQVV